MPELCPNCSGPLFDMPTPCGCGCDMTQYCAKPDCGWDNTGWSLR